MEDELIAKSDPLAPWTFDTAPACDVGLVLLRRFAENSPGLYELAERVNFIDPTHPGFKANPFWLAFADHYQHCDNCNEVEDVWTLCEAGG